ncbi:MAG: hypothetical protein H6632_21130 [Anaerolineales bacterium]|nr:hypothetical protein [Anaerolineales bacterium]
MEYLVGGLVVTLIGGVALILRKEARRTFEQDNALRERWRDFAARHELIFVPGEYHTLGPSRLAYVTGFFQGRRTKLDTYYEHREIFGRGEVKTLYLRLVMAVFDPLQPPPESQPADSIEPVSTELIDELLGRTDLSPLLGRTYLQADAQELYYEQPQMETDPARLQAVFDTVAALAGCYAQIIDLGGPAIDTLHQMMPIGSAGLQTTITQLMRGIALKTTLELGQQVEQLLCPHCLTRFTTHTCWLSAMNSIHYVGCRLCRQSRAHWSGPVIAVLNQRHLAPYLFKDGAIHINWLTYRTLFDFDAVEIISASDEAVERFAVQVGNDTDLFRRSRYKGMDCKIRRSAGLSANSIRILRQTFG